MGYHNITLHGEQICDYLYIQDSPVTEEEFSNVNSEPTSWNKETLLFAKFDNSENKGFIAGDSSLLKSIVGYEIRRKKNANSYSEYVATIKDSNITGNKFLIDYMAANNSEYTYYLYPSSESSSEDGVILSPSVTEEVKTNWGYWSLLVVDESDEDNVFYISKIFKFELNFESGTMSNNTKATVIENFTKHPMIQHGMSNYWSGSLTSLCGFLSCNDNDYIQTPNMINEIKNLFSDTRRKFLKDIDGNIWEVDLISPLEITTDDKVLERIKTLTFTWAEIGDASNISIINNPDVSTTSWILTETGEIIPYITYIWDSQYKWDNSYIWTSKNDTLENKLSNEGRNIITNESEV